MGKYYKVNQINQLMKKIQKETENALVKDVGREIFSVMKQYMLEDIYSSYSPEVYERTYKLLNSLTVSPVISKGNIISIKIYVPNKALRDEEHRMLYSVPELNLQEGEDPTLSEVLQILEGGYNKYRPATDVIDKTYETLVASGIVLKRLMGYLKTKGFNVI